MGREIVYCAHCGGQIRAADFDKQSAFRVGELAYCRKCIREGLKDLPSEKVEELLFWRSF